MKKIISMLILSLGLAQVTVAAGDNKVVEQKEVQKTGVVAWIKNHPKTTAALVAALAGTAGTAATLYFAPESTFSTKVKGGKDYAVNKAGEAYTFYMDNKKYTIPATVVAVVATAVAADLARGEKSMVKKAFSKKKENKQAPAVAA